MYKRYTILFSLLLAPTLQAADPDALKYDVGTIKPISTLIAVAFNVDYSIERGVNNPALATLKGRLNGVNEILRAHHNNPEFEQQTVAPLEGSFTFLQKTVADFNRLHRVFNAVRGARDPASLAGLSADLRGLSDSKQEAVGTSITPILFAQLAQDPNGDDLIEMGDLFNACKNNRCAAIALGLEQQKDLIAKLILATKSETTSGLLQAMQLDIDDPTQFQFHEKRLGRIINAIHEKQKNDSSVYPEKWIQTVQTSAWGILGQEGNKIYEDFQKIFDLNVNNTVPEELADILCNHNYTTHSLAKRFLSRLERYKYQLEYLRPSSNLTIGLSTFTDSARYDDHKKITTKLIDHLHSLYPGIVTALDEARMDQQDPYDLMVKLQAQGFQAVISGIRNELKGIKRKSVQEENQDFAVL